MKISDISASTHYLVTAKKDWRRLPATDLIDGRMVALSTDPFTLSPTESTITIDTPHGTVTAQAEPSTTGWFNAGLLVAPVTVKGLGKPRVVLLTYVRIAWHDAAIAAGLDDDQLSIARGARTRYMHLREALVDRGHPAPTPSADHGHVSIDVATLERLLSLAYGVARPGVPTTLQAGRR